MSILTDIFTAFKPVVHEKDTAGNYFYTFSSSKFVKDTLTAQGQAAAYEYCAALSSIINRKAIALINAKWWLLNADNKEANGQDAENLKSLFLQSNPIQSFNSFLAQLYVHIQIFGEAFVYVVKPVGFDNTRAKALWILPNAFVGVEYTGLYYKQHDIDSIIKDYFIEVDGQKTSLGKDSIIHIKDFNINLSNAFRGSSRLVSLSDNISNIIAAYEARNVLLTRKGAIGILSNVGKDIAGQTPLLEKDKKALQDDFKKYGLSKQQAQVIITSASLQWQSMTFPTKDLMLFEEIEDDVRQIADTYGYPMFLLGFKNGTTFNNYAEAKKALYSDTIIPECTNIVNAFNSFFETYKLNFTIQAFYDHLDIFQQSVKDLAESKKIINESCSIAYKNKIITLQEWRIALDLDPDEFIGNTFYNGQESVTDTPERCDIQSETEAS